MPRQLLQLDRSIPHVMGVLNVTPDSFSDGGHYFSSGKIDLSRCCQRVDAMMEEGASLIDVGGESTRPGAAPVSIDEEMERVLPVIEKLAGYDVVISLDSSKPEVMREAAKLGIGMINDVRALQQSEALAAAASLSLPVCLMHMQGDPLTMQKNPAYFDVVSEVSIFLEDRINACLKAGILAENILVDPGFGFGKTAEHNAGLLSGLSAIGQMGFPMVVGMSRKSMISQLLGGRGVTERTPGSLALAVMAVERGAWIIRAHDIKETVDAITIAAAVVSH